MDRWRKAAGLPLEALGRWLSGSHPRARRRRWLAAALALGLGWALFGGDQGLFSLLSTQRQKARLRAEIVRLEAENAELEKEAARLGASPQLYEKTAREKLLLKEPGEVLYRFRD